MFISALGAITGTDNRLGFKSAKKAVVVLVDGLGSANLKAAGGHAPNLNAKLANSKTISCAFPSTTVASITSFATGVSAGSHGLIGYQVFNRETGAAVNLLTGWSNTVNPLEWQSQETVTEKAIAAGVHSFFVGPAEYADSGFTRATMRGSTYVPAKAISDRFSEAKRLLSASESSLTYLYVPELDQTAHAFGASSQQWIVKLEELESGIRQLVSSLPSEYLVVLTADHGIVDVPISRQIYLDEVPNIQESILNVSGDPRVNFLYLKRPEYTSRVKTELEAYLGDFALVMDSQQIIDSGWYGSLSQQAMDLMPDIMVIAKKRVAFYHRNFAKPQSLRMIGQHGAMSHEELSVPLLIW